MQKKIVGNFFPPEKKVIFAWFFATPSIRSRSLDQPLVPGVSLYLSFFSNLHALLFTNFGGSQIAESLGWRTQSRLGQENNKANTIYMTELFHKITQPRKIHINGSMMKTSYYWSLFLLLYKTTKMSVFSWYIFLQVRSPQVYVSDFAPAC